MFSCSSVNKILVQICAAAQMLPTEQIYAVKHSTLLTNHLNDDTKQYSAATTPLYLHFCHHYVSLHDISH